MDWGEWIGDLYTDWRDAYFGRYGPGWPKFPRDGDGFGGELEHHGGNSVSNDGTLAVSNTIANIGSLKLGFGAKTSVLSTLQLSGQFANDFGMPVTGNGRINFDPTGSYAGWGTIEPSVAANGAVTSTGGTLLLLGTEFSNSATLTSSVGTDIIVRATSVTNTGNIVVNAASSVSFAAPVGVSAGHSIALSGGAVGATSLTVAAGGSINGFGQISAPVINAGNVSINGPTQLIGNLTNQASGNVTVRNSQLLITGTTNNSGIMHAQAGGSIVFDGGLTGNPVAGAVPMGAASLGPSAAILTPFIRQSSLTLGGTAGDSSSYPVASIRPAAEGGQTSVLGALTFQTDGGGGLLGKLDLADTALIVNYDGASPLGDVRGAIRSAYNAASAAHWTGPGLTSSVAARTAGMALGYAEASEALGLSGTLTADFRGETADATSVLVRYTIAGDANLDGSVGFADLVAVAQHYGLSDGSGTWFKGDVNYDGNVGFADLVAVAQHYGTSLPSSPLAGFEEDLVAARALVPEPSGCVLVLGIGAVALRRRRGRKGRGRFCEAAVLGGQA